MKEVNLPEPEFNTEGMFSIVFKRLHKTVEKTVEKIILKLIVDNPKVTSREIIQATGLSRRGLEYQTNKLKYVRKIERIGSANGGYWQLIYPKNTTNIVGNTVEESVVKSVVKTVEELILGLIRLNPKVTIIEMTKATGLTRRGVEYNFNKLKDNKIIERIGPDRGGFWQVKP